MQETKMKTAHLKTNDNHGSSFMSYFSIKTAFLIVFFAYTFQSITLTKALHNYNYPGNETDHLALLAVKSQLIDHPGGVLSSWNNSVHHCKWEGITCGRKHNRVTRLDMHSRNLSGTISPSIANLSFLNMIWLANNSIYGKIPHNLGDLFRLHTLALSNNTLIGEIPGSLSSCRDLRILAIESNNLNGILPAGLRALSKLEYLSVGNNKLTGPLFDIIQNLTSLQEIYASFNTFTGIIPHTIGRMQNLTNLGLTENKLSGTLPASLFNISSLQVLDLPGNLFQGELPSAMGLNVPSLTWLGLAGNNFSGSISIIKNLTNLMYILLHDNSFIGKVPDNLQQFRNLYQLTLSLNYLEGDIKFIRKLVNCTQLVNLQLEQNNFFGILPGSVANLSTTLTALMIGDNYISGVFPAGITNLINLQILIMTSLKLSARFPHDLPKLQKLEFLDLSSNGLTGKILNSLSNLSYLSTLYLDNNKLEQYIPQSIGNCQSLLYLGLSNNELTGTLDNELFTGSATFLEVDLSHNHVGGTLPSEISKQTSLVKLTVSHNNFSGLLPDGLSECTELKYLYMERNSFEGDIPSSYSSLASFEEIDFSLNNLSGPLPVFFTTIPSVNYLNLAHNDFQGIVPTNSVFANASEVFLVGNNRLCGGIPRFRLPKCIEKVINATTKTTTSKSQTITVLVISALVVAMVLVIGISLASIKKKNTPLSSDSVMGETFIKVSYDMLLKATGGFSSESLLGSGSFGSVFKGILDEKQVAVKVLHLQHHAASKSFIAECKALRNVRHRNLVGVITACSSIDFQRNDFKALVYEFMPNGSVDKWLHGVVGNMNLPQRVGVAIDVAHALTYLHLECEAPIVHCDLKPSNILLDDDMVAHVGDFGLARFLTQPRHPNQSSTLGIMGTVGYAAPEYGLGSEASTAGHVYSYGILLLELMTGKSPTNNMFKADYNLHTYAQAALPGQVLQIVDPTLEDDELTEEADDKKVNQDSVQRRVECVASVITVGVLCSKHLPQDRLKIPDVISMLQAARDNLVNAKQHLHKLPTKDTL